MVCGWHAMRLFRKAVYVVGPARRGKELLLGSKFSVTTLGCAVDAIPTFFARAIESVGHFFGFLDRLLGSFCSFLVSSGVLLVCLVAFLSSIDLVLRLFSRDHSLCGEFNTWAYLLAMEHASCYAAGALVPSLGLHQDGDGTDLLLKQLPCCTMREQQQIITKGCLVALFVPRSNPLFYGKGASFP